jgi:hypothetical protein
MAWVVLWERHHLDKETNMSLVHWDPFHELEEMSTRLDRVFAEEFQIKAELPEVKKEDVKVSVDHVHLPKTEKAKPAIEVKVH